MNRNITAKLKKHPSGIVVLEMAADRITNAILKIKPNGLIERYILSSDFVDRSGIIVDSTGKILINRECAGDSLLPTLTGNHKLNLKLSVDLYDRQPEFRVNVHNDNIPTLNLFVIENGGTLYVHNANALEKYFLPLQQWDIKRVIMIDDLKFRLVKNGKSSISLYVKYADVIRNLDNGTIGDGVKILTIENGELTLHKISKIGGIRRSRQGYIKLSDRTNILYSGITQNYTNTNEHNCTNLKFELKKENSYCRYGVRKCLKLKLRAADSMHNTTLIGINPSGKMIIYRLFRGYGFAVNYDQMVKLNYER